MMSQQKKSSRHWRVVAQELGLETDPEKVRVLLEELTRAIHLVRYEESDEWAPSGKPM
jgi:hypothetical protein